MQINLHFITHFIKHYRSATRIDVLHSPFVFSLYNSCIARQDSPAELCDVEALRKELRNNSKLISQHDLGARRSKQENRVKPVSFFARRHAKPPRIAHILYRIIKEYNYKTCVELGTSLGITGLCMAKALHKNAKLITIEGAPEIAELAKQHFNKLGLSDRIEQHTGNFDEILPDVLQQYRQVDFAFVDGNHTYEGTMSYFKQLLANVNNNSVLIFDDIYWSKGMTKAWEEIKQHPGVTVTVDLFYIGLVYFRKEQVKEHFKLRVW